MNDEEKLQDLIERRGISYVLFRLELAALDRAIAHAGKGESDNRDRWELKAKILRKAYDRLVAN
jgi:hypothetical protein